MATNEPNGGEKPPLGSLLKRLLIGEPRDLTDRRIFHRLSLIPFLAWVGLGADGLSSSSYGPEEAFRTLGQHTYLALGLALLTAFTVFLIASAYSRLIEAFPHGGGGYIVASKLLGPKTGLLSGCALLVDYVMTITVSIAAAGDALFSFLPMEWHIFKLPTEVALILGLSVLNIRGVRESVLVLLPVFLVFLVTHVAVILGGLAGHATQLPATLQTAHAQFNGGLSTLGAFGMFLLFIHAYSMGGGTYTGLEAVSNGLPIMHEPRVPTAKRTMLYMAVSLAFTAGGLLLCYLLWDIRFIEGKTMNAALVERLTRGLPLGMTIAVITLVSEGALLIVGAQAGFIDGPRVLANLALDSWAPRRFAALSDRLTTANGIVLMGSAAMIALLATKGDVRALVVMYSINVFLTFSLSMFAMARSWWRQRASSPLWRRRFALFVGALALCVTILTFTVFTKFEEGGWVTVSVTGGLVILCLVIRRHYRQVGARLQKLYDELKDIKLDRDAPPLAPDPTKPTAAVLVAAYSGLGIHTVLSIQRMFPGHFHNFVFLSVGAVDSNAFKAEEPIEELKRRTEASLKQYMELARGLRLPAAMRYAIGADVAEEAEKLCRQIVSEFPQVVFFAGKIIFGREGWTRRLLHNEMAYAIQRRLQWSGTPMVILPARLP